MMNVLAITNLFPNEQQPGRGVFNKQQFAHLKDLCDLTVVAPLPWTPIFIDTIYNLVSGEEELDGIKVYHPRHIVTPKIGRRFYGYWYYRGIKYIVGRIQEQRPVDLIFATWGYPDCYGAYRIAQDMGVPMVARVHGTDINVGAQNPRRAAMMNEAFEYADTVVANSNGLKTGLEKLGVSAEKIEVIINGVNTEVFRKLDRDGCRDRLDLSDASKHILYIGNFVEIKGLEYLISAMAKLPDNYRLHMIGSGGLSKALKRQAAELGVDERVVFHGRLPHEQLAVWFNAADVFCLPSLNEGCPNVILESLACGTPVAASAVGAIPDLVDSEDKGALFEPKNPDDIAAKIRHVTEKRDPGISVSFDAISWKDNAQRLHRIFEKALRT